jgi:hypothetical protein
MRLSKCLFIAAASVAMTGVAFADDPVVPTGDATGTDGTAPPADGAKPDAGAPAAAGGMFTADTWPKAYVERDQVIYKGGLELSPKFLLNYTSTTDTAGNSTSSTVTSIGVAGRYGITEKIEALFSFDPIILTGVDGIEAGDRVKGKLTAGAGIGVLKGKLDLEVKAALQYDLALESAALLAGVDVRYHLGPKMWIGTPVNRPGLVAFVKPITIDIPMVGSVDFSPIFFNVPVAFAYQATPELAIQANTALFRLNLNEDAKGGPDGDALFFVGSDEFGIPFDIDVIYAVSNKMDVQGNLNFGDLKNAGDAIAVTAGVNIRL